MKYERLDGYFFVLIETNEDGAMRRVDIGAHIAEKYGDKTIADLHSFVRGFKEACVKKKKALIKVHGRSKEVYPLWRESEEYKAYQALPYISTGNILRAASARDTRLEDFVQGVGSSYSHHEHHYKEAVMLALWLMTKDEMVKLLVPD
jgi:hypothetical protein